MNVCKQMIGADTNGAPKVWINPDPVAHKPWSPCSSEEKMIKDILVALEAIEATSSNNTSRI